MTSLESRIRADADTAAGEITAGDIPPLRRPAARRRRGRGGRSGHPAGPRSWLIPLAAAASVVAIAVTMIVAGQAGGGSQAPVRPGHPAASGRAASHPDQALGPEALDFFFPATGAQYTDGQAYAWEQRKLWAQAFGSCMARAGFPQPPFTEPERSYLDAAPDNSQFPDLAQRARTGTMDGTVYLGTPTPPESPAGKAAMRNCQGPASKPAAAISQLASPLQAQWLGTVTAIQRSARVSAEQPGFAACLEAHGVPSFYAQQQRPTASNPLFTGFFSWMDNLGMTARTARQSAGQQHRWTPVFVRCAGPTVSLVQRLQLAARTSFFGHHPQQIAAISQLATELPDAGR